MDAYEYGFADGRADAAEEYEEKVVESYDNGFREGFDSAAEQHGKDVDELRRQLMVKDQEIDLLRKRVAALSHEIDSLTRKRNLSWHLGYDQAVEDLMEKEAGRAE